MAVASVRPLSGVSLLICLALADCGETEQSQQEILRPVRVVTVEELTSGEPVSLSGVVQAEKEVDLAFRIGGRLVERTPGTGDQVTTGQVVARLDPEDETNSLRIARSVLYKGTFPVVDLLSCSLYRLKLKFHLSLLIWVWLAYNDLR